MNVCGIVVMTLATVINGGLLDRWIRRARNKPRLVSLTSYFGSDGWTKWVRLR